MNPHLVGVRATNPQDPSYNHGWSFNGALRNPVPAEARARWELDPAPINALGVPAGKVGAGEHAEPVSTDGHAEGLGEETLWQRIHGLPGAAVAASAALLAQRAYDQGIEPARFFEPGVDVNELVPFMLRMLRDNASFVQFYGAASDKTADLHRATCSQFLDTFLGRMHEDGVGIMSGGGNCGFMREPCLRFERLTLGEGKFAQVLLEMTEPGGGPSREPPSPFFTDDNGGRVGPVALLPIRRLILGLVRTRACVIQPGGFGTIDEAMGTIAHRRNHFGASLFGYQPDPAATVFLSSDGFYDGMRDLLGKMALLGLTKGTRHDNRGRLRLGDLSGVSFADPSVENGIAEKTWKHVAESHGRQPPPQRFDSPPVTEKAIAAIEEFNAALRTNADFRPRMWQSGRYAAIAEYFIAQLARSNATAHIADQTTLGRTVSGKAMALTVLTELESYRDLITRMANKDVIHFIGSENQQELTRSEKAFYRELVRRAVRQDVVVLVDGGGRRGAPKFVRDEWVVAKLETKNSGRTSSSELIRMPYYREGVSYDPFEMDGVRDEVAPLSYCLEMKVLMMHLIGRKKSVVVGPTDPVSFALVPDYQMARQLHGRICMPYGTKDETPRVFFMNSVLGKETEGFYDPYRRQMVRQVQDGAIGARELEAATFLPLLDPALEVSTVMEFLKPAPKSIRVDPRHEWRRHVLQGRTAWAQK